MGDGLKWEFFNGLEVLDYIDEIAKFRIKYFRDFPYLYDGNVEYESKYLKGYASDQKSLLIIIRNSGNEILAVATAIPLVTSSDILKDAEALFLANGLNR